MAKLKVFPALLDLLCFPIVEAVQNRVGRYYRKSVIPTGNTEHFALPLPILPITVNELGHGLPRFITVR